MRKTSLCTAALMIGCAAQRQHIRPDAVLQRPTMEVTPVHGRARDLGVPFVGQPGPWNAITDVPGVLVGHTTIIDGVGEKAIRTGVTAILPREQLGYYPAATFALNGDGELLGAAFAEDFGVLRSPIMLTGTWSTGTVFNALARWSLQKFPDAPVYIPVIADTWDADLNDHFSFPLSEAHVFAALDNAKSGPVDEGNVGGGTGMICHEFKGGIGTASRVLPKDRGGYTVGVLVQANYGRRETLTIAGVPVGKEIQENLPNWSRAVGDEPPNIEEGSILVIIATDAPVSAMVLRSMAKRGALGLARCGGNASPTSGDFFLAFSTQTVEPDEHGLVHNPSLAPYAAEPLFTATAQATEEAIINALVAARTMVGKFGAVTELPESRLVELLSKYNRLKADQRGGAEGP